MAVEMIRQKVITSQAYQNSVKRLLLQPLVRVSSPPKTGLKNPEKTTYIKDLSLSSPPLSLLRHEASFLWPLQAGRMISRPLFDKRH